MEPGTAGGIMIVVVLHTFKWFSLGMVLAAVLPKCARDRMNLHRKVLSAEWRAERALGERGCIGKRWMGQDGNGRMFSYSFHLVFTDR